MHNLGVLRSGQKHATRNIVRLQAPRAATFLHVPIVLVGHACLMDEINAAVAAGARMAWIARAAILWKIMAGILAPCRSRWAESRFAAQFDSQMSIGVFGANPVQCLPAFARHGVATHW